jgi:hypothetical protein
LKKYLRMTKQWRELQFFQKGTKEHTSAYWAKQKELIGDQHENNKFNAEVNELQKKEDRRMPRARGNRSGEHGESNPKYKLECRAWEEESER